MLGMWSFEETQVILVNSSVPRKHNFELIGLSYSVTVDEQLMTLNS